MPTEHQQQLPLEKIESEEFKISSPYNTSDELPSKIEIEMLENVNDETKLEQDYNNNDVKTKTEIDDDPFSSLLNLAPSRQSSGGFDMSQKLTVPAD